MPKALSIEDQLAELAELGKAPDTPETRKQLRKYLASKKSPIVARAAQIVSQLEQHDFIPDLVESFHRFMIDPTRTDKGCAAKNAIVKALLASECDDEELFKTGINHVQLEPTWGGRADTAAQLRALCGLGLVQVGSPDAMDDLAVLLADKETDARIGAANALGHCGPNATPILRLKALVGDEEPAVVAECLSALMSVSPIGSFGFVAQFIDPQYPALYEHAALALAESKVPGAVELLLRKWSSTFDREFKQTLLLPIALTRTEDAQDFIITMLEDGDSRMATAAIATLGIYRGDSELRERAEKAIDAPNNRELLNALRRVFE